MENFREPDIIKDEIVKEGIILRTSAVIDPIEGNSFESQSLIRNINDEEEKLELYGGVYTQKLVYGDTMVIYSWSEINFLDIRSVIDLKGFAVLEGLTKKQKYEYFKTCYENQQPPLEPLNVEVLDETDKENKIKRYYIGY